jgi:hypothetical protein
MSKFLQLAACFLIASRGPLPVQIAHRAKWTFRFET